MDMPKSTINGHDFELTITLAVSGTQLDFDINQKLHIPNVDTLTTGRLTNMMAETAAIHARWSVLSNQAAHAYDVAKIRFEVWEKQQLKRFREGLIDEKHKKQTERMIEESVMSDPEYIRRYEQVLEAKENASNVRSIAFAFGEKGDRLVNISSLMKMEINRSSSSAGSSRNDEPHERNSSERENRAFSSSDEDEGEDA